MPATPGNSLDITAAGLVKFDGTATFSGVTTTQFDVLVGAASNGITSVGPGSAGQVLQSGGNAANPAYSTPTYPSASGTSGKVLISDGTNNVYSTPTFPNASATSGKFIRSDGTNWIASTPTLPTSAGTSGKVLQSNGTNYVESTPTYPSASGTTGTILRSDGTNNIYTTATYPATTGANTFLSSVSANTVSTSTFIPATSWAPNVQFGGANVGITYSTQSGYYLQIENIVYFSVAITLTNKGSSTGAMTISNLPVSTGANGGLNTGNVAVFTSTLGTGYTTMVWALSNSSAVMNINICGSAKVYANLTNTGVASSDLFYFTGHYFTT